MAGRGSWHHKPNWRRYSRLWGSDPVRDVDDELEFHLEMKREELSAAGVSPQEIETELHREFGDPAVVEAELRSIALKRAARARRSNMLDDFMVDLRHAWGSFSRRPAVPAVIVGTMALSIGAGTAVFSLIDAVLLNPLPVTNPSELIRITQKVPGGLDFSYPISLLMRERSTTTTGIAGHTGLSVVVRAGGAAEQFGAEAVTGNYFDVLGLQPQMGRLLQARDEAAPGSTPNVVLSDALWRRLLGADPRIVGSTVQVNEQRLTVVGIAPPRFRGTTVGSPVDIWFPITMAGTLARGGALADPMALQRWTFPWFEHFARPAEGVSSERVSAELAALYAAGMEQVPADEAMLVPDEPVAIAAVPLTQAAAARTRDDLVRFLTVLAAVVSITLAIACVNVANLLLMRATERQSELAIRSAVGASGARVARQLLVESGALAVIAAVLGLGVAWLSIRLVGAFSLPGGIPLAEVPLELNGRILAFSLAVAAACAALFGVAPARLGARTGVMAAIRGVPEADSQRRWRGGSPLLGAQVALTLLLLVAGSLFVHSLQKAMTVDLGFRSGNLAALSITLQQHGYSNEQGSMLLMQLRDQALAQPGLTHFAAATRVPIDTDGTPFIMHPAGAADRSASPRIEFTYVTPGYFEAFDIQLRRGRDVDWSDRDGNSRVAVLSQAAAELLWPGLDPIGRQFVPMFGAPATVVGIVEDVHFSSLTAREPQVFLALAQSSSLASSHLQLIGGGADDRAALAALRDVVRSADPRLAMFAQRSVRQQVQRVMAPQRFGSLLLSAFGMIALLISAVGIYAVASYDVARRNRELGIRAALGAQRRELMHAVVAPAAVAICGGALLGLVGGMAASRALRSLLFGITPYEPLSYVVAVALLGSVAILAALLPARRAGRADPLQVIRS